MGCNGDFEAILDTQSNIFHAGRGGDSSLMLALDESLVDPCYKEAKGGNVTGKANAPMDVGPEPFTFLHLLKTRTEMGILGNSHAAHQGKGGTVAGGQWPAIWSRQLVRPGSAAVTGRPKGKVGNGRQKGTGYAINI
ncbi:MAG: hypothetical protein ACLTW9_01110 [Enterocloster sp.]